MSLFTHKVKVAFLVSHTFRPFNVTCVPHSALFYKVGKMVTLLYKETLTNFALFLYIVYTNFNCSHLRPMSTAVKVKLLESQQICSC